MSDTSAASHMVDLAALREQRTSTPSSCRTPAFPHCMGSCLCPDSLAHLSSSALLRVITCHISQECVLVSSGAVDSGAETQVGILHLSQVRLLFYFPLFLQIGGEWDQRWDASVKWRNQSNRLREIWQWQEQAPEQLRSERTSEEQFNTTETRETNRGENKGKAGRAAAAGSGSGSTSISSKRHDKQSALCVVTIRLLDNETRADAESDETFLNGDTQTTWKGLNGTFYLRGNQHLQRLQCL